MPEVVPPAQCLRPFDPLSSQESRKGRLSQPPLVRSALAGVSPRLAASLRTSPCRALSSSALLARHDDPLANRGTRTQRFSDDQGVVGVVVPPLPPSGLRLGLNFPTTIVTFEPFFALPVSGVCSMTTPSPSGESTSRDC